LLSHDENVGNFHLKRDEGKVVLTLSVGRYGYISLLGIPTTFIMDMANSAPRFMQSLVYALRDWEQDESMYHL
jgi:hypothetical protein